VNVWLVGKWRECLCVSTCVSRASPTGTTCGIQSGGYESAPKGKRAYAHVGVHACL
jgi:hypothetical protein